MKTKSKKSKNLWAPRTRKKADHAYARLCWGEGYVIVKDLYLLEDFHKPKVTMQDAFATLIYGSRREYKDHGKKFRFSNIERIEKISKEEVVDKYFMGLL